jgi:hypothetical protein
MGLERMGTHSESCYKWHLECAVSRYEALRARVETAERAYEVEHANCVNLTEKVIPNLRARVAELEAAVRAMVLEASQTMQMRDEYQEWDEFERLAATVLRVESI